MASQLGTDSTSLNSILKEQYDNGLPMETIYKTSKLLGLIPKKAVAGLGELRKIPVRIGNVVSTSATFATALASTQAAPTFVAFDVLARKRYTLHGITGEAMAAAQGDMSSFVDAVKEAVDSATYAHGRAISGEVFGDGSGQKGTLTVAAAATANSITIRHREARNWEIGDTFRLYPAASDTAVATGHLPYIVSAIDRNTDVTSATPTATLTFTCTGGASPTDLDDALAGSRLIKDGDLNVAMYGLEAWIPTTRSGLGTAFCGVTRSVDSQRLAGLSGDISSISSAPSQIVRALRLSHDAGQTVDTAVCSPSFFEEVSEALGAKDTRERMKVESFDGKYGYSAIKVAGGGAGEVSLLADPDCPDNRLFLLEIDTWYLAHDKLGLPFMEERDGNKFIRSAASDGMDFRLIHYGNLVCKAPGRNASFIV